MKVLQVEACYNEAQAEYVDYPEATSLKDIVSLFDPESILDSAVGIEAILKDDDTYLYIIDIESFDNETITELYDYFKEAVYDNDGILEDFLDGCFY